MPTYPHPGRLKIHPGNAKGCDVIRRVGEKVIAKYISEGEIPQPGSVSSDFTLTRGSYIDVAFSRFLGIVILSTNMSFAKTSFVLILCVALCSGGPLASVLNLEDATAPVARLVKRSPQYHTINSSRRCRGARNISCDPNLPPVLCRPYALSLCQDTEFINVNI
ncbi:uncharacterized protein LOC134774428 [Penaeus indicus]|uniref:uncharacterized protein LOC134774428 n=1 Tax=Penaeus indicus TaxID=29960 RepID=UPI00300C4B8A